MSPSLPLRPFYCSSSLIVSFSTAAAPRSRFLSRASFPHPSSRLARNPQGRAEQLSPFVLSPSLPSFLCSFIARYRCSPMVAKPPSPSPSRGISRRRTFRIACYYICRVHVSVVYCEREKFLRHRRKADDWRSSLYARLYDNIDKPVYLFNNSGFKLFEIDFSSERVRKAIVATGDFPILMTKRFQIILTVIEKEFDTDKRNRNRFATAIVFSACCV